jgi:hypothetical protein
MSDRGYARGRKLADIILLDGNPLGDHQHAEDEGGRKGRWVVVDKR